MINRTDKTIPYRLSQAELENLRLLRRRMKLSVFTRHNVEEEKLLGESELGIWIPIGHVRKQRRKSRENDDFEDFQRTWQIKIILIRKEYSMKKLIQVSFIFVLVFVLCQAMVGGSAVPATGNRLNTGQNNMVLATASQQTIQVLICLGTKAICMTPNVGWNS